MKKLIILSLFTFTFSLFTLCHGQSRYVDSLKTVLANTNDPMKRFDLINKIEGDHWISGKERIDSFYVMQMVHLAEQLNNDSLRAISYFITGDYYQNVAADYQSAVEFYLKGIPLAEKANDKFWLTILYAGACDAFCDLGNHAEALNYVRKAEASLPDKTFPGYNFALRQVYADWFYYYSIENKPDSAMYYIHAVSDINSKVKSPFWESIEKYFYAQLYWKLKDTALTELYFKEAVNRTSANEDYYTLSSIKNNFAAFLLSMNRIDEAKTQAMQSFTFCTQHKFYRYNLRAADLLRQIYYQMKNMDSAYYFSQIVAAMKDSTFNQQKMNRIQALAFTEQIRVKEEEVKKELEHEQQRENIQYILIALGIVTFSIIFLLLSRRVITNEKIIEFLGVVALLIVFEFLNLIFHPFLDRITNHTPLLMLLALVCMAALLVPLHHRLEKWATHRLVEKNKQIRLAAAKKTIEKLESNKTN